MEVRTRSTRLVVLRGNSGSGKSSAAAEVRARYGRGIALVGQDYLRRAATWLRPWPTQRPEQGPSASVSLTFTTFSPR